MIACDVLPALKKARNSYPTDLGKDHYDLISAIQNLHKCLPFTLNFEHFKGHQNQGLPTASHGLLG